MLDNDDRPDVLFLQASEYAEFKTALEFCKETGSSTHKVDDVSDEITNKLLQSGQQAIKNAKRYLGKSKLLDREALTATETERVCLSLRVAPSDASVCKLLVFLNDVYFMVDCEREQQRVTIRTLNTLTDIVQLQAGPNNSLVIQQESRSVQLDFDDWRDRAAGAFQIREVLRNKGIDIEIV